MAKVIHDGPYKLAGAVFTTLVHVQGMEQIKNFMRHSRSDSNTSKLLRILLSWSQHHTGWHSSILLDVDSPLPHFEARWLKSLRQYLTKISAIIKIDEKYVYSNQQIFDKHIMPKVCKSGDFLDKEIQ
eukprot:4388689-Ditylum_brightwellii.AAC.1